MPSIRKAPTGRSGSSSESFPSPAGWSSQPSPTRPGRSTATPSVGTSHRPTTMRPSSSIRRPMPNASSSSKEPTRPRKENEVRPMQRSTQIFTLLTIAILLLGMTLSAQRRGGGGGGGGRGAAAGGGTRSSARTSVNSTPTRSANQGGANRSAGQGANRTASANQGANRNA